MNERDTAGYALLRKSAESEMLNQHEPVEEKRRGEGERMPC